MYPGMPGGKAYLVYVGGGIVGVGLLLIGLAAVQAVETRLFLRSTELTEARVVGGITSRRITVAVTLPDGKEAVRRRTLSFDLEPARILRIHPNPTDPGQLAMRLDDPRDLWGQAWSYAQLGLLLALLGSVPLWLGRRSWPRDHAGRP